MFEVPLEELLERQLTKFPTKLVPTFLESVTSQIEALGNGLELDQNPSYEELKPYRSQLDSGTLEISTLSEAHVMVGLCTSCVIVSYDVVKLWFKELPIPLIPQRL